MSKDRCCCNCRRNIRTKEADGYVRCNCEIDGHYIGYVECFEGWCKHHSEDLTFNRYGRLVVEGVHDVKEYTGKNGHVTRAVKWLCKCDCGNEVVVDGGELKRGQVKSCGCLRQEKNRIFETHTRRVKDKALFYMVRNEESVCRSQCYELQMVWRKRRFCM